MVTLSQTDTDAVAASLVKWLKADKHATDVRVDSIVLTGSKAGEPGFAISFAWQMQHRAFRYVIRRVDPIPEMARVLRVESQGELLVQMPNSTRTGLEPNIIYYPARNVHSSGDVRSSR